MSNVKSRIAESMKSGFFKGTGIGVGLGAGLLTTGLFAAALSMNVFAPGEVISSAKINKNFEIAAPEGAIMAFYLANCPDGWALADGTNGTPDLRGMFVRGLDARDAVSGGNDPDGPRALGSIQLDAFQGHWHSLTAGNINTGGGYNWVGNNGSFNIVAPKVGGPITDGTNDAPRYGKETRPKNVALTYCMRKN